MSAVITLNLRQWDREYPRALQTTAAEALESGRVVHLPDLPFVLHDTELGLLTPACLDSRSKNISYEAAGATLKGSAAQGRDALLLQDLMQRFQRQALALVQGLLPSYHGALRAARTSYRPATVSQRRQSPRQDDRRLHVDAFPSRPNRGDRILRVFSNIHPHGLPRTWQIGESFEDCARHFMPRLPAPRPALAALFNALGITLGRRSAYDHYMLHLHDMMKTDAAYQAQAPRETYAFAAGTTWLVFSDQTLHAALSGQYLLEQTCHVPVSALERPDQAPLRVLERLTGQRLV